MPKLRLNQKSVAAIIPPKTGQIVYMDSATRYLGVIVRESGSKSYYYIRRVSGKLYQEKIAPVDTIGYQDAVEIVAEKNLMVAKNKTTEIALPCTLRLAFEVWEQNARAKNIKRKSIDDILGRVRNHIPTQMLESEIKDIRKSAVQALYNDLSVRIGQTTARRTMIHISAAVNCLIAQEYPIDRNPAKGIAMAPPVERERFLQPSEMPRFFEAVKNSESEVFRDFVFVLLFTSKRRSHVAAMRWDKIDFDRAIWYLPAKSTKKETDVAALDPAVIAILHRRREEQLASNIVTPWVFYSPGSSCGYYQEPKTAWKSMLRRAGLADLRIHDLRRTLASYMAAGNTSLHIIAGVLGQKSTGATPIYARLALDPKREAIGGAISDIVTAAGIEIPGRRPDEIVMMIENIKKDDVLAKQMLFYYNKIKKAGVLSPAG